jgi:hypothetical protein
MDDSHESLAARIREAARNVLGDSRLGIEIAGRCEDHFVWIEKLHRPRAHQPVIAVGGGSGQGKTWFIRQWLGDSKIASKLEAAERERAGIDRSGRTAITTWIAPMPPHGLDPAIEQFIPWEGNTRLDVGTAVAIADLPAPMLVHGEATDEAAYRMPAADVLILVIRRDQLRSQVPAGLARGCDGIILQPVINACPSDDPSLEGDREHLMRQLQEAAPSSRLLTPIELPDQDKSSDARARIEQGLQRLNRQLRELLTQPDQTRKIATIASANRRLRQTIAQRLKQELPALRRAVDRLNDASDRLPMQVVEELQASDEALVTLLRARLRGRLIADTAPLWFPYRSLLGLLNLTSGAWDRLILAMAGSLPSLISTAWTSAKNVQRLADDRADGRQQMRLRAETLVGEQLRPSTRAFRDALRTLRSGDGIQPVSEEQDGREVPARLHGLEQLQGEAQRCLEDEVKQQALPPPLCNLLGVLATAIFVALLWGPIAALYGHYWNASQPQWEGNLSPLDAFPKPTAAMLLTSLILSVIPVAILAMLVVSWVQRRSRAAASAASIRQAQFDAAQRLQREGIVQLGFDDPLLADAQLLLSL